jgi:hypothetical protein
MTDEPPAPNDEFERYQDSRLNDARELRNKLRNLLWIANGGGAATILTSLHPEAKSFYLLPFVFFILGLIALVLGAYGDLRWVYRELRNSEDAERRGGPIPLLGMQMRFFLAPSEKIALRWTDQAAIIMFVTGVVSGFAVVVFERFQWCLRIP